jgi:RimJ/RimL family protein N-acetyltransferase
MMVPVLETERLVLREHRESDFPAYAAMWSDPEFLRHLGPQRTEEESWNRFLVREGMWSVSGFGLWAVAEKLGGAFVGNIGFMRTRRNLPIDCGDLPEAGWTFASATRGKGYAREAAAVAFAWADAHLDAPRTWCLIAEGNAASLKLAAWAGYQDAVRVTHRDEPALVLTRERP